MDPQVIDQIQTLTTDDIMAALQLKRRQFYENIRKALPRPIRINGGHPRWFAHEFREFLEEHREAVTTK